MTGEGLKSVESCGGAVYGGAQVPGSFFRRPLFFQEVGLRARRAKTRVVPVAPTRQTGRTLIRALGVCPSRVSDKVRLGQRYLACLTEHRRRTPRTRRTMYTNAQHSGHDASRSASSSSPRQAVHISGHIDVCPLSHHLLPHPSPTNLTAYQLWRAPMLSTSRTSPRALL